MNVSDFKSKDGYAQMLVITPGTLDGWIKRHWKNGREYVVIGHTTLVHIKRADKWIKKHGRLESLHQGEGFESGSREGERQSTTRPSQVTPIKQVISGQR